MKRKGLLWLLNAEAITLLLVVCVYGANRFLWPGDCFNKWGAALCNSSVQWLIFVLLLIILVRSVFSNVAKSGRFLNFHSPYLWLLGATLTGAGVYSLQYSNSYHTAQAISWFSGAALGQWAATRLRKGSKVDRALLLFTIATLTLVLSAGATSSIRYGVVFKYHDRLRWSGLLDNPNIWGLLMGTGFSLAFALGIGNWEFAVRESKMANGNSKLVFGRLFGMLLCVLLVVLMGRELLHTYSRGAWVAAFLGFSYLVWQAVQRPTFRDQSVLFGSSISSFFNWTHRNWLSVSAIILSIGILTFWQFRLLKQDVTTSRVFSIANLNDFSWQNRINAWEGALQITAEHPWLGTGWNQPGPLYEHYYLPPKLDESSAIEMNDYLMLSATLGVPALVCFGMYIWLSLADGGWKSEVWEQKPKAEESEIKNQKSEIKLDWLQTTCRAGAITLAVGFWFDGGLFVLATGSVFWILLELGQENLPRTT